LGLVWCVDVRVENWKEGGDKWDFRAKTGIPGISVGPFQIAQNIQKVKNQKQQMFPTGQLERENSKKKNLRANKTY